MNEELFLYKWFKRGWNALKWFKIGFDKARKVL